MQIGISSQGTPRDYNVMCHILHNTILHKRKDPGKKSFLRPSAMKIYHDPENKARLADT